MILAPTVGQASPLGQSLAADLDRLCIWVVSPTGYDHARAFDEVALALAAGLAEVGSNAAIVTDPADLAGRRPIVVGANLLNRVPGAPSCSHLPSDAVIYNLEQVDDNSAWFGSDYLRLLGRHHVLDYSPRNLRALHDLGIDHAELLEIGWVRELERIPDERTGAVDVCFYGSTNARRAALLDELERRGLVVERLFGVYGPDRDAAIARAKLVLNVHFYEAAVFEAVRVSYLMANGVCVVTEGDADDPDLAPYRDGLCAGPYEALADRCVELAADRSRRVDLARAAKTLAAARPQSAAWRRLLEQAPATARTAGPVLNSARPAEARVTAVTILHPRAMDELAAATVSVASELRSRGIDAQLAIVDHHATISRQGLMCTFDPPPDAGDAIDGVPIRRRIPYSPDHLIVLPDVAAAHAPGFLPFATSVWWLDVEPLITAGGPLAEPGAVARLLGTPGIRHFHSDAATEAFLTEHGVNGARLGPGIGTDPTFTAALDGPCGPA